MQIKLITLNTMHQRVLNMPVDNLDNLCLEALSLVNSHDLRYLTNVFVYIFENEVLENKLIGLFVVKPSEQHVAVFDTMHATTRPMYRYPPL